MKFIPCGVTAIKKTTCFLKTGYEQIRVNFEDIYYLEATGNYVNFVLKDKTILSRMTITDVEALLPAKQFVRIHRSFIVALSKIDKIERHQLLVNGSVLPVSVSYQNIISAK